ncbi:hypothetical protein NHJ13051_008474 [Beauveria bassiana]
MTLVEANDITSSHLHSGHREHFIETRSQKLSRINPATHSPQAAFLSDKGTVRHLRASFSGQMATKEPESQPQRTWVPATIGVCHWQTANDRFGPDAKAAIRDRERVALGLPALGHQASYLWTPEFLDQESVDEHSIYSTLPATQCYRNNLTALSQAYNVCHCGSKAIRCVLTGSQLYFVAYQSYIFVYVPRSIARQRLPRRPDHQFRCEPSKVAPHIGGYVDQVVPHSVNHLTTGFLGNEEIVVACCDDGEVYAYYTREIAEWIALQENSPLKHHAGPKRFRCASAKPPTHFFRENVGVSAWGLAVHRQSRLIAVSSNRREVTVFAFALQRPRRSSQQQEEEDAACGGPAAYVRKRSKNWRIVIALGQTTSNIPNICFIDDEKGGAEKVAAVDIDGCAWIADIWNASQPVSAIRSTDPSLRRSEESVGESSRGWGVLALSDDSFMTVNTLDELIGGAPGEIVPAYGAGSQPMADVEPCVRAIPDNPCPEFESGLDRMDNLQMLFPGQNALQAIASLLGNAEGVFGDDSDEDQIINNDANEGENEDEEDEVDDEDDADEGMEDEDEDVHEEDNETAWAVAAEGVDTDYHSDVSWDGDEFVEEIIIDHVLNEGSTQADPHHSEAPQTLHHPWWYTAESYVPSSPDLVATETDWDKMGGNLVYFPHSGRIAPMPRETIPLAKFLKRSPREYGVCGQGKLHSIPKNYHLIRAYEKDVELRTLRADHLGEKQAIGIYCPNTLTFGSFHDRNLRPYFRATSRMSLIMHVPELSLVIIGSPTGRVLLLTPTRLSNPQSAPTGFAKCPRSGSREVWSHGLRVEWVLPRSSDDICHGQHRRPLHGVAVGPVQDERGVGAAGSGHASTPRRYRLMLHYRNHDIATFEITRQEQTGKLCIF